MAGQRVSTTPMASRPPTSSMTTAMTALAIISRSAWASNCRPERGQVRYLVACRGVVGTGIVADMSVPPLFDVDAADHRVMVDSAVFVADDREGARLVRRHLHHVLVARH